MRVAVIADTHDKLPPTLPGRLSSADEIWHLGDVCQPATLEPLEALGRPLRVVLGNNDWSPDWPAALTLARGGVKFHLVHIAPFRAPSGVAAVLHGHTHVPRDETDFRGVRWLNPGCISRANRGAPPSFAWLEIEEHGAWRWVLERV